MNSALALISLLVVIIDDRNAVFFIRLSVLNLGLHERLRLLLSAILAVDYVTLSQLKLACDGIRSLTLDGAAGDPLLDWRLMLSHDTCSG